MAPLHGSETSLAKPPFSPQSCSSFSPRSALSLLVAVRWQAVNQSPGLSFGGVGKNYLGSKGNHPGACCSCWSLRTLEYSFLHRYSCCKKDCFPCSRASLRALHVKSEDGCVCPASVACVGICPSLLLLCSDGSAPSLLHNAKSKKKAQHKYIYIYLLYSACPGMQNMCLAGLLALAFAPAVPYLADGTCKTHPVMLSHGAAEDL